MGKIYDNITDTVGRTPLVRLKKLGCPGVSILAKLEFFNPCSSVKDRIALAMIESAGREGLLNPETVIIEPTSGNTGIGLAFVCAAKGYKLILVMPDSMSIERGKLMQFLGAQIVLTPAAQGMKGAVEKAKDLHLQTPNSMMPQQFENPANPEIHRLTTAGEIWNDTGGNMDFFVAGVGTGGTITGCGQVFKKRNPDIKIVAVEPEASPVLSGGKPGAHLIQGIGAGFIPDVLDRDIIDEIFPVSNEGAIETSRLLAAREGILAGISAGAALFAAIEISKRPPSRGKTIVFVAPDTAERYISTRLFE